VFHLISVALFVRDNVSEKNSIKSLLKEADLYRDQGFLKESKAKYLEILELAKNHKELSKDTQLIDTVNEKIGAVEDELAEIDQATKNFELSEEEENLIKNLFSFSKTKETAALEGAVALAKFGQYERALVEFQKFIKEGILPAIAAKNMLMCHLSFGKPEAAIDQLRRWIAQTVFSKAELKYLRDFLQNTLKKKGIEVDLPNLVGVSQERSKKQETAEEVLEISAVRVKLDHGPRKGQTVDFDITFQLGNAVTIFVRSIEKDLLNFFKPGARLSQIQLYSPMSIFNANAIVIGNKRISSGPRKGEYSVDLKIIGT
jgi:tetratricopeptide (TPR) repeat protein